MKSPWPFVILCFLLPALCMACHPEQYTELPSSEDEGSGVFVSVVVDTDAPLSTRVGSPAPGEEGDGQQPGVGDENKVRDLNVFFFQGDNGINEDGNPPIVCQLYFSGAELSASDGTRYYSAVKEVTDGLEIGETYQVLVIANLGRRLVGANTLNALRDWQVSQPVTDGGTNFLMASESGAEVTITPCTQNNPVTVTVEVERMAARVDCHWEDAYEITGGNMVSVGGNRLSYGEKDQVEFLGAALVNRYRGQTWAFKRVINMNLNEITYLGDEITYADGIAYNYVLDPLTMLGKDNADYNYYYTEYVNWDVDADFRSPFPTKETSTHNRVTYTRWAYACENVNLVEALKEGVDLCATGVLFQARYTPAGFAKGETFYVYPAEGSDRKIYTAEALSGQFPDLFPWEDKDSWGLQATKCEVYSEGRCYYVYWIRHADDGNDKVISPMEYAIVRNNIYQLDINSVSGLGTPEPDSNVEEVKTDIHVQVKDWRPVEVSVPPFD